MSQTKNQDKQLSPEEIYVKLAAYCAYQDRCRKEVAQKLAELGVEGQKAEVLMARLEEERFLDENRYAESFTRGRFYQKKWGREKIRYELRGRGLSSSQVDRALAGIPDEDYRETIHQLLERKAAHVRDSDDFVRRQKLARYLIGKGFESALVWEAIDLLMDR